MQRELERQSAERASQRKQVYKAFLRPLAGFLLLGGGAQGPHAGDPLPAARGARCAPEAAGGGEEPHGELLDLRAAPARGEHSEHKAAERQRGARAAGGGGGGDGGPAEAGGERALGAREGPAEAHTGGHAGRHQGARWTESLFVGGNMGNQW